METLESNSALQIVALGGLGEIGMNMMAYIYDEDIIIVDCGLMFPGAELLGIDLVIPDISYLVEKKKRLQGIILTHAHEDHIGALPYILRQLPVPVFGTRLTLGLLGNKLREHGLDAMPSCEAEQDAASRVLDRLRAGETLEALLGLSDC